LIMVGLAAISLSLFTMVDSSGKAQQETKEQINARYVAEAGLSVALMEMQAGASVEEVDKGTVNQQVSLGDGSYWVEADGLGNNLFSLRATGVENGVGSRLELVVREVAENRHIWAAFGEEGLTMDSNAKVDSYNSGNGSYDDQDVNGNGSNRYANSNGHVGSNQNVSADSNVKVWGNATPGPAGTASIQGNATVSGSTTPATALVEMPAITVPSYTSLGDKTFDGSGNGAFNDYIPTGEWRWGDVEVDMSPLEVIGPATLVFSSLRVDSNSEIIVDASNGPVEIYVEHDFVLNSNAMIASDTYTPADITINLLSDNVINPQQQVDLDEVDFDSNAQFCGVLYAPSAYVEINSNFELFGSLVARRVHLDSNSKVHFDEALLNAGADDERVLELVAFHHTPFHP